MKLSTDQIQAILLGIFCILVVGYAFISHRNDSKEEQLVNIREEIYKLFLYAEKQDWLNEEKMTWVVHAVYSKFPNLVKIVIKETTLEEYVQTLYDEFKQWLQDGNIKDFHFDLIPAADSEAKMEPISTEQNKQ